MAATMREAHKATRSRREIRRVRIAGKGFFERDSVDSGVAGWTSEDAVSVVVVGKLS